MTQQTEDHKPVKVEMARKIRMQDKLLHCMFVRIKENILNRSKEDQSDTDDASQSRVKSESKRKTRVGDISTCTYQSQNKIIVEVVGTGQLG